MKYFDTFAGVGAGTLAITQQIFSAENVGFSEIDKYAEAVYKYHFPKHKNFGDITKIDIPNLPDFDLLIGGSPCQDLSVAKINRAGLEGARSSLFFKFVEIRNVKKPTYFILENVASMRTSDKDRMSEIIGFEPTMINSALVSAQSRKRLFWVGKLSGNKYEKVDIPQPIDRQILLRDILEENVDDKYYLTSKKIINYTENIHKNIQYNTIKTGYLNSGSQGERVYSKNGKSVTLSANGGGRGAKTGLYNLPNKSRTVRVSGRGSGFGDKHNWDMISSIRRLSPVECERLQTFPDNWTAAGIFNNEIKNISDSQRYKQLGNSFTVDVIKHIISQLFDGTS